MQKESDNAILKLEEQIEKQREELLLRHNRDLDEQGRKMKTKIDDLERDYKTQVCYLYLFLGFFLIKFKVCLFVFFYYYLFQLY